jgi:hypothetical protein
VWEEEEEEGGREGGREVDREIEREREREERARARARSKERRWPCTVRLPPTSLRYGSFRRRGILWGHDDTDK